MNERKPSAIGPAGIFVYLLTNGLAVFATAYLLAGASVDNASTAILVGLILGAANMMIGTATGSAARRLPRGGAALISFLLMGAMVLGTSEMIGGFHVAGYAWALVFAFVLSVVDALFHGLAGNARGQ